ncbi:hypothetical protein [Parasphingorhabdus sp.]|uniref:hypothetical protein n=1 Tax=Parasphingorhabdus sp. TaxID=2709688 RepID=UPI003A8EA517
MKKLPALVTIITVTLSGCAMQEGDFPSLLKRPYEDEPVMDAATDSAAVVASLPTDVEQKLNDAVAQSRAADAAFEARLPAVKSRVDAARGSAVSSELWVVAQMELAGLEMVRSPSVEALADIDTLYRQQLEREASEDQSGGTAVIARQRDAVNMQVDRQQGEIDAMKNRLR